MSSPREPGTSPWGAVLAGLALVVVAAAALTGPFLIVVGNRAARYVVSLVPSSIGDALPSYVVNTALDWGLAQGVLLLAGTAVVHRLGHRRSGRRLARRPAARPPIARITCGSAKRPAIPHFEVVPAEPRTPQPSQPARQLERIS